LTTSYFVFGLHLRSNVPLSGVVSTNSLDNSPDVELHLGMRPYATEEDASKREELAYASSNAEKTSNSGLCVWRVAEKGLLRIAYSDGTQFWLETSGKLCGQHGARNRPWKRLTCPCQPGIIHAEASNG